MSAHTIEVRPNEVAGWDILHDDDPDAITNVATRDQAVKAAEVLAHETGEVDVVVRDEPHELSDVRRGVMVYVVGLLGLLAAIAVLIVVISLVSSALNI
jgi:Uncharacterized protein conserved in bacteria (DUF2188)